MLAARLRCAHHFAADVADLRLDGSHTHSDRGLAIPCWGPVFVGSRTGTPLDFLSDDRWSYTQDAVNNFSPGFFYQANQFFPGFPPTDSPLSSFLSHFYPTPTR